MACAELYFMDSSFALIAGPADGFTSITWSERYFEPGTFRLLFPRSLLPEITGARYVRTAEKDGEILCGRIEYLDTGDGGECEMRGHLLEILLADRVLSTLPTPSADPESGKTDIAALALDAVEANLRGAGIAVDREHSARISGEAAVSGQWDSLSDWCSSLLRPYGASYEIRLREWDGALKPVFRVIRGTDRSSASDGARAIFSGSFGNILSISFTEDSAGMKNAAYIEGADGTVVLTDRSGDSGRRELYRKAADIAPGNYKTAAEYELALKNRGEELLAARQSAVSVSAECDANALPVYGTDYRLGDICDVSDDGLGLSYALRLTAVDTVWEDGAESVYPVFGEQRALGEMIGDMINKK